MSREQIAEIAARFVQSEFDARAALLVADLDDRVTTPVPATTALYRLAPPAFLAGYTFEFKVRQKLNEGKLKAQLTLAGYSHVTQVVSPGEYAVRGGLIDLFPMGSLVPFRVDLFDDEIDSIHFANIARECIGDCYGEGGRSF